ncbi:hypothetical protein GBAR_LOCUS2451 [Geodia barretti]|uniref:Uncharacterized protein n=1 Tax=Geodia barretti TaxID=519541 RepID=A0AA35QZM5_GEOBA|nr:hypothetical protein GBAR_LOCUS2451 [Geodia barretti]
MAEPAATSNQQLMFSTEEWGMVSKTQIERPTVPGDMDEDKGVLVVWTRGMAGQPGSGWTARHAISGDAVRDALIAAGLIPEE